MMARLGHEDGSSTSPVAQSSDGVTSVTQREGRSEAVVASGTCPGPGMEPVQQLTTGTAGVATKSNRAKMQVCQDSSDTSPSSLDSGGRPRTASMCSSGKESSSGGEQLAQAVRGASLAFTSSSSSSSLCSEEGHGDTVKGINKLETLKEESADTVRTDVEEATGTATSTASRESPAGCKTGEGPKESLNTAGVVGDGATMISTAPLSGTEATAPSESGMVGTTAMPVALQVPRGSPPKISDAVPGKDIRPHSSLKQTTPRSAVLPMVSQTGPPNAVTHGFVTSTAALTVPTPAPPPKNTTPLRRGKWTVEEEIYVARVIQDFNSGFLNAPAGTTLRSYLSEKLHCDPMRITKKFTGDACIGKRVFHPAVRCASNATAIDKAQAELDALEQRWRRRLEMQQRESAKKAAASAAAAAAASGRGTNLHVSSSQTGLSGSTTSTSGNNVQGGSSNSKQSVVARTASWLDRATAVLSTSQGDGSAVVNAPARAIPKDTEDQIENQMNEVRRLIHEGPIIQQTTAGLPHLLHGGVESGVGHVEPSSQNTGYAIQDLQGISQPVDKRPRRSSGNPTTGAEDAEALVGFLNSVRAAASSERSV